MAALGWLLNLGFAGGAGVANVAFKRRRTRQFRSPQVNVARAFNGNLADRLRTSAYAGPATYSLSAWIYKNDNTGVQSIIGRDQNDDALRHSQFRTNTTSLEIIPFNDTPAADTTASQTGIVTGKWQHAGAVVTATTSQAFVDGAGGTVQSRSGTNSTANIATVFGNRLKGAPSTYLDAFDGLIAEPVIWHNLALDAAEMLQLAKGKHFSEVRAPGIIHAYDLHTLHNLTRRGLLTLDGTVAEDFTFKYAKRRLSGLDFILPASAAAEFQHWYAYSYAELN